MTFIIIFYMKVQVNFITVVKNQMEKKHHRQNLQLQVPCYPIIVLKKYQIKLW